MKRTSPLVIVTFASVGLAVGLIVQFSRSARGISPFVLPLSLAATLAVMAAVLLVLGIALRRAVTRASTRPVNPFHAVRLLAGAKASQFAGALFGGFGGGLALQLLTRSVPAPPATWLPLVAALVAGVLLVIVGVIVEHLCRVPPDEPEQESLEAAGPEPGATDQRA